MIIILSPGRCGSSTVARLLHTKLNISMGTRFRKPDQSNPRGYYEDLDFRNLNHALLNKQIPINYFQKQLKQLINNNIEPFGIKDPRICHLWQYYRAYKARYIICTRRPQLVVKSLVINYGWSEKECKNLLLTRLNGINKMLEGHDALRIDFTYNRTDTELTHLLQRFLNEN